MIVVVPDRSEQVRAEAVFGINAVKEVIAARPVEYVMVAEGRRNRRLQEIVDACRTAGIPLRFAPRPALDRAAGSTRHQGVVAVCSARAYDDLETVLSVPGTPLVVVLDGVEDPANLGAILRTAVAIGASGVIVPERRSAPLSAAVARAAAGAVEHAKIARVANLVRTLVDIKRRGLWIYGLEPRSQRSYLDLDYKVPCAVVLGGEGRGLHRLVRETCDQLARIPVVGGVESLNVSVAASVVLYEAARQRNQACLGQKPLPVGGSNSNGLL